MEGFMPRRLDNSRGKHLDRSKTAGGRYSTLDNASKKVAASRRAAVIQKKKKGKAIALAALIVLLTAASALVYLNWGTITQLSKQAMLMLNPTEEPIITPVPSPTPTPVTAPTMEITPTPTAVPSPTPKPDKINIVISAVGDLQFYQSQIEDAYSNETGEYDFSGCFRDIAPSFANSDLVIGNFNSTCSGPEQSYSDAPKSNTPESVLKALKDAGFDVLTLANSHIFDYGWLGVERTYRSVLDAGLKPSGIYMSDKDYYNPLIVNVEGVNVAVLSYTANTGGNEALIPKDKLAYCIKYIRASTITEDITAARANGAHLVVVYMHWGEEYKETPNDNMRDMAQIALDAGADAVIGTYPQVIQEAKTKAVNRKDGSIMETVIAYSLGNFITSQRIAPRDSGVILNLSYEFETATENIRLSGISYVPTWVSMNETDGSDKNYRVLPVGYYINNAELLSSLPSNAQQRIQEVWQHTTSRLGTSPFVPQYQ